MDRNQTLAEAERLAFPYVYFSSGYLAGERRWREQIGALLPGDLELVRLQLVGARVEGEIDSRRAEREAPLTFPEEEEQRRILAKARAIHERHEGERPQRIEALLYEIRDGIRALTPRG